MVLYVKNKRFDTDLHEIKYGLQILVYNFYNPHKIEVKKNDMSNILYRERETCIHKIKCRELPEVEMKVDL